MRSRNQIVLVLELSDVESTLWTGAKEVLSLKRLSEFIVPKGPKDSARGFNPWNMSKKAPPCLSAVIRGRWDEGGRGGR